MKKHITYVASTFIIAGSLMGCATNDDDALTGYNEDNDIRNVAYDNNFNENLQFMANNDETTETADDDLSDDPGEDIEMTPEDEANEEVEDMENVMDYDVDKNKGKAKHKFKGHFSDVDSGQWYSSVVENAKDLGILNGVGDNKFQPNKPMTRAQVATLINNLIEKGYLNVPNESVDETEPAADIPSESTEEKTETIETNETDTVS